MTEEHDEVSLSAEEIKYIKDKIAQEKAMSKLILKLRNIGTFLLVLSAMLLAGWDWIKKIVQAAS